MRMLAYSRASDWTCSLPPSHEENARPHYLEEGTPVRASGAVDMPAAFWEPEPDHRWVRDRT